MLFEDFAEVVDINTAMRVDLDRVEEVLRVVRFESFAEPTIQSFE